MSTPDPTLGQTILAFIEGDALRAFGAPLLTFLQAEAAAAGDPIKMSAAFIALQGGIVGAAPGALGTLESQLATALATKLQAVIAAAPKA